MNMSELASKISEDTGLSMSKSKDVLSSLTQTIQKELSEGNDVSLVGFGKFEVKKRAARTGRNPQTGEAIEIKEANIPSMKAGKALKDACNN